MKKTTKKIAVKVLTGLHIGVGSDRLQIGGVDSPVIKDVVTGRPYIPGSSIKGKLRCLLETEGEYENGTKSDEINMFFGCTSEYLNEKNMKFPDSPTRLIFRDLHLTDFFKEKFDNAAILNEVKTEIKIDRKKGTVEATGLRTIERVPPTVEFEGEILIRYTDDEELKKIFKMLNNSITLLNNDYLGGSGSRGYGAVAVNLS